MAGTVEHLTVDYVLEQPDLPREVLVAEVTRLVAGYLDGTRPRSGREKG